MSKSTSFNLPVATLSYPHLQTPDDKFSADNPKYKCQLIFDKGTDLSELRKAIETHNTEGKSKIEDLIKTDEDGRLIVSPRSKFKVACYNKSKVKIAQTDIDDVFYGGARVKANVSIYAHNFGVSIGLGAILFIDDGERLGGGGSPFGAAEGTTDDAGFPA
jgi:hypothetical protein